MAVLAAGSSSWSESGYKPVDVRAGGDSNDVNEITLMLQAVVRGEEGADEKLMSAVYDELRLLAAGKLARESANPTLQPTALVHEAWLRLGGDRQPAWGDRRHFFGAAAEAMRRILVDRARRRGAVRHGGGQQRVDFEAIDFLPSAEDDERLVALHDALTRLESTDADAAQLVKLHYFVGLSMPEAAQVLGISEATAWRWWRYARAWLFQEMRSPS